MEARRFYAAVKYTRAVAVRACAATNLHTAIYSKHWAPVHEQRGAVIFDLRRKSGMHQLSFETS
jgi:hypothetical protein